MLCGPPLTSTMLCPPTCGWLQERQRGYKKKNFIQVGAGLCGMGMRRRLWVGHRGGCVPCIHPPASLPPCLTAPLFRARFPPAGQVRLCGGDAEVERVGLRRRERRRRRPQDP